MKNPKISIILPIYKVKKEYAEQCIKSIKEQTYKNFEVICIFDGSDKETINFCKLFIDNDKRFKCISRGNMGVSFTRNEGISKSKGEWITFIDADDWYEKEALETFINNRIDDISIDFYILKAKINSKENKCSYRYNHIIDERKKNELFQSTYGSKNEKYSYCESVWKNFYKKTAIVTNEIVFPEKIKIGEDLIFNYRVWSKCENGYFIDKAIYNYRINNESVMNSDYFQLKNKYSILFPTFEEELSKIEKKFTHNHSNFVIKQIKRFYLKYGSNDDIFNDISSLIKEDYYKENIKKSKISSLNIKNKIFLFALKIKNKKILKLIIKIYNKQ